MLESNNARREGKDRSVVRRLSKRSVRSDTNSSVLIIPSDPTIHSSGDVETVGGGLCIYLF
jgi:hypothetical protein